MSERLTVCRTMPHKTGLKLSTITTAALQSPRPLLNSLLDVTNVLARLSRDWLTGLLTVSEWDESPECREATELEDKSI